MGSEAIAIRAQVPNTCQIMLFSATFPPEVMTTAHRLVPKPVTFRLARCIANINKITMINNIIQVTRS